MAEVTNELMYELLKAIRHDIGALKETSAETRIELNNLRSSMISIQGDINNIYGVLARHDRHLERIENRLDLREMAEPPRPYDPGS